MPANIKKNPYGIGDFANLRNSNCYYVDRTDRIPLLEEMHYQLFLRPRRFGKSLLLSMLRYYYDINAKDRFDELFMDTWIHENPTPSRNRFMVMRFDFSTIEGTTVQELQQNFDTTCKIVLNGFVKQYSELLPNQLPSMVIAQPTFNAGMKLLQQEIGNDRQKIYILIDEYDNFANHLLAQSGEAAYRELCHGDGFFKKFFALLKAQSDAVTNIFMTGVSPMALDDVTSGFNIAPNISQKPQFATLCGFTHDDIRAAMDYYAAAGKFEPDREEAFRLVTDWYDHYRFSPDNDANVINPTLFLGFLADCGDTGHLPDTMSDENFHTDYYKLRHLVTTNGMLNGKFQALETLAADGSVTLSLVKSFQADTLTRPESFLSLLFYYGMAAIGAKTPQGFRMVIPNLLMRQYIAEFIREGYADTCNPSPRLMELANLLASLAMDGDWRPAIELAAEAVRDALSPRDLLDGEKAVQAAMAAYCSAANAVLAHTEHRAGRGFADLSLVPDIVRFPTLRHAALIELKYIKKKEKRPGPAVRAKILADAREQLEEYAQARNIQAEWSLAPNGPVMLIRLCLVFHGETLLLAQEI